MNKEKIIRYYSEKGRAFEYSQSWEKLVPLGVVQHNNHINFINKIIKEKNIKNLLEFAIGSARISKYLNNFKQAYGVDSSKEMLDIAKNELKRFNMLDKWKLIQSDIFKFKINKKFDLVISFRLVWHFKNKDREKFYNKIKSLLANNGYFIFDAQNYDVEYFYRKKRNLKSPTYDKLWKKNELINELEKNGFKVVKLYNNIEYPELQRFLSRTFRFIRLDFIGIILINFLEKFNSKSPMEWIVLCKKS